MSLNSTPAAERIHILHYKTFEENYAPFTTKTYRFTTNKLDLTNKVINL